MKLTTPFSPPIAFLSVAASLGVATILSSAAPASAISGPVSLGFVCDTVTGPPNSSPGPVATACQTGQNQFSAVVSPLGSSQARFTFSNIGSLASSITNIEIVDFYPVFAGFSSTQPTNSTVKINSFGGSGSFFSIAVNNSPLTGPGVQLANQITNGINPSDIFSVDFDIVPGFGKPFNAVATQLFRGGLSVQLQAAGFNPVTVPAKVVFNSQVKAVPEPITMLGSAAALGFGALMKRRSSQLKSKKGLGTPVPATCEILA
jgi:hypothetical protein